MRRFNYKVQLSTRTPLGHPSGTPLRTPFYEHLPKAEACPASRLLPPRAAAEERGGVISLYGVRTRCSQLCS